MASMLVLVAFGIVRLTRPLAAEPAPVVPPIEQAADLVPTPFFLTLSAPASEVILECGEATLNLTAGTQQLSGSLPLTGDHPSIFITIRWQGQDQDPKFAKLRLEPAGLATQEKIFDSVGELSDVWEPHLH
jgi:hypothetical protein